jgi:sec-independent protein translocase protein TatA
LLEGRLLIKEVSAMTTLFGFLSLSPMEMMILLGLGVLLFGRKLPEVGRSLGKGIIEFKKGLKGLEDDVDVSNSFRMDTPAVEAPRPPQRIVTNVPKFEDPAPPHA